MADGNGKKTIDERLDALTMNLELQWHQTEAMRLAAEARDKIFDQRMEKIVTSIEKLVTVMESHERRIDNLESGDA